MGFGNIGIGELMMIFMVVMLVFGPKRLPEIARNMGKFMRDFRRETNAAIKELKDGIEPINVGIFDEPDAGATAAAGNGAATPMPGVAAAGGAGVAPATTPMPTAANGSATKPRPAARRSTTASKRKPASTAKRKTTSSSTTKKRSTAKPKRPASRAATARKR